MDSAPTTTRLTPEQFLLIIRSGIASEWSLASTGPELKLFTRYEDGGRIYEFLGPNEFGYSHRELVVFAFRVEFAIKRARSET